MDKAIYFNESQRFNNVYLWIVLALVHIILIGVICAVYIKNNGEHKPKAIIGFWIGEAIAGLVTALVLTSQLLTTVREDGIYVKFTPFISEERRYAWEDIKECYIREYQSVKEYGGWGVRSGGKSGSALNISGNKGIQLVFKNGERMLIGTNEPAEAAKALQQLGQWKPAVN